MRISTLLARNLAWYWRTNLAVLLGVATATGILGGALLVGASVRATLRRLVLDRLGNAEVLVVRNGFFREELAAALAPAAPLIAMEGTLAHQESGRRAGAVQVYGVDERFWKFQGYPGEAPRGRAALVTAPLAAELGAGRGETLLLRLPKPSAVPLESLHGARQNAGKTVRLEMAGKAPREFALQPQQGDVRAVFVPLERLQRELGQAAKVNTVAAAARPDMESTLRARFTLADLGLRLRLLEGAGCEALETDSTLVNDALAETAESTARAHGLRAEPVLAYLANGIRVGTRTVPYSVVAGLDGPLAPAHDGGIVLNTWAARDLGARTGDAVEVEYFVWQSEGRLHTATARFRLERIVPLAGDAADPHWTPEYPGITEAASLREWDPPFPLDLGRIRPIDEQYWDRHRATPKAFVRLSAARRLWGTRFGNLTSLRIRPPAPEYAAWLREAIDPAQFGLTVVPVKERGLEAARGATDFGEYFIYFSFFLVVSALLLTGLFFRLGIEQRAGEIGVLRALGFSMARVRAVFLLEGAALAAGGAVPGVLAALAYGALILFGLRTLWFDAVGTRSLSLDAALGPLAGGAGAGMLAGLAAAAWTLRGLRAVTARHLLSGAHTSRGVRWRWISGALAAISGMALAAAGLGRGIEAAGAFFGAGALLLSSALLFLSAGLHARHPGAIAGPLTLGLRGMSHRPGRSVMCVALMASATFIIVSLDAFRRDGAGAGAGGFPLLADSVLPLIHNPNGPEGRSALNLPPLGGVRFVPFRVRPGDDTSCLNLYQPRNPRILAPPASFLRDSRFAFQEPSGKTSNPWLLLESRFPDGAVPAIADANSLAYVLHRKVGEDVVTGGVRFRIVAALHDSLFQGELLISEANFLRVFPDLEGYRFFLIDAPGGRADEVTRSLEEALSDYGFDVQSAPARLAGFHRVENAYLATFRALGGLGLILGTVGLAAVLMRNVLERRRELALLRAVGFRRRHLAAMVLAENVCLLLLGLAIGTLCALVAIAPAAAARGGHLPAASLGLLLGAVLGVGVVSSVLAAAAAWRAPVLEALRSE